MSKSLARKKSDKKKKGEHSKSRLRVKEYAKSRAPHCSPGPGEHGVPSMLVRNHVNELLRIEIKDWQRVPGESCEMFQATAVFRNGERIDRMSRLDYRPGEREEMLTQEFSLDTVERAKATRKTDALRRYRWSEKQRILGELQREFGKGMLGEAEAKPGHAGEAPPSAVA